MENHIILIIVVIIAFSVAAGLISNAIEKKQKEKLSKKYNIKIEDIDDETFLKLKSHKHKENYNNRNIESNNSIEERHNINLLKKYKEMLDNGLITQEEYDEKKAEYLENIEDSSVKENNDEKPKKSSKKKWWIWILIIVIVAGGIFGYTNGYFDSFAPSEFSISGTKLTVDNAEQYLNINLKGGGDDIDYVMDSYQYQSAYFGGTISGISGYTYSDVTITITCKYSYDDYDALYGGSGSGNFTLSDTQTLNVGGNANFYASDTIQHLAGFGYCRSVECDGYEITSITGTVTKN